MNLGVRWDHYDVYTPDQHQLAYTFPSGLSIPAKTFPETHYVKWNGVVPRLGVSYDLLGTGKTVLKANWGLYKFNPGVTLASDANPNQAEKTVTYQWLDNRVCSGCIPGDKTYQAGEEGSADGQRARMARSASIRTSSSPRRRRRPLTSSSRSPRASVRASASST